ncbi:MAG: signal peptide peptidase SppA [Flavobacteriaceae bacterium]|nr:signal peptide peptidase SppA [Flavobacteriaceae bacterium]
MNFFKNFLASILGTLTALGLFFTIILILISATASIIVSPSSVKSIKSNSVLDLNLNFPITDRNPSFDELEMIFDLDNEVLGLPEILSAINKAAENPDIKGIRLRSDFIPAGWSQTRSIRNALLKFKEQGKFIYSYADFLTQKGYYLASVADSIILNPVGVFEFKGLASEVLYYKDFQDQYGVKMEVVRHGKYKSAVEPYLENEMSAANRFQISSLINDIWETLRDEIAVERNLNVETLDLLINEHKIGTPEDALIENLIDGLGYEIDVKNLINIQLKQEEDEKVNFASVSSVNQSIPNYNKGIKDRIAVVFAKGPILYGEGTKSVIAQGVFVNTLKELADDDWIKAIVLRIDSPGGSALTSELLWKTIEEVKKTKPVLVSIGNVAASGGYYIASGADQIFADPLSITGSIGVFASLPNLGGLTNNMGINAETVETHPDAIGYSIFQPMSDTFKKQTKKSIESTYITFKKRVSEGRKLSETVVENIAQGRVWTGKQALEVGLVDSIGGLQDTIEAAARLVGIENYNIMEYPKFEQSLSSLLTSIQISIGLDNLFNIFLSNSKHLELIKLTEKNLAEYLQLALPFEIKIH